MNGRHFAVLAVLGAGCSPPPQQGPAPHQDPPSNRIAVPDAVRKNLGITFVKVERRRLASTLRLPGAFESLPQARAEHRAPLAGRLDLRVQPLQPVAKGDVLFTIDAPEWRALQRQLGDLDTEAAVAAAHLAATEPLLAAHQRHEQSLQEALLVMQERVQSLIATNTSVGGQAQALAEARVQQAQVQAQIAEAAEQHTETSARIARLTADGAAFVARRASLLAAAQALFGAPVEARWRELDVVEVRATTPGVVDAIGAAPGAFVAAHDLVVATLDPTRVRFRASALQGDLGRLADGQSCEISPAGPTDPTARVTGPLQLAAAADPVRRTLDVFVVPTAAAPFVRPGVAGFVAITTDAAERAELAIPRAAVLPDGLARVFFRRDPGDPDKVIRVEADLGRDDGRWVEIKSGLVDGDEVVLAGAFELVLTSAGSPKGGHFHADGTWHADDHK
jgi:multidrug efflux pump subunit AcrA (membrane-fusion protein)